MTETLIGITATVFAGMISFIVTRYERRLDASEKKVNEIVTNYLSRFDDLKARDEEIKDLIHKSNTENHQSHADIMEFVHYIRAKLNELTPRDK